MSQSASVIIPVYNEQNTVEKVVGTIADSGIFEEVICVNDGSCDKSLEKLAKFTDKATIINLEENKGKGYALAQGIKTAKTDIVVFLDADFENLSEEHVHALMAPLEKKEADYTIGLIRGNRYAVGNPLLDSLSGQRAYYKRDLLEYLPQMEKSRYGVEILLNEAFKHKRCKKVHLKGLKHLNKYEKNDPIEAINGYLKEGVEIAKELGKREVISQEDFQILRKISHIDDLLEVRRLIKSLKSSKIRSFLLKYFGKYLAR